MHLPSTIPLAQMIIGDSFFLIPLALLAATACTVITGVLLIAGLWRAARVSCFLLMSLGILLPLVAFERGNDFTGFAWLCVVGPLPYGALLLLISNLQIASERARAAVTPAEVATQRNPHSTALGYWQASDGRCPNIPALASLLMGMLLCIPAVAGIGAVVCGVIGRRKGREPSIGGRRMATIGLCLGIVSIALWCIPAVFAVWDHIQESEAEAAYQQFFSDLSSNNPAAAMQLSSGLTSSQLQADADIAKKSGRITSTTMFEGGMIVDPYQLTRIDTYSGYGWCTGPHGTWNFTVELRKIAGTFRVTACTITQ